MHHVICRLYALCEDGFQRHKLEKLLEKYLFNELYTLTFLFYCHVKGIIPLQFNLALAKCR